MNWEELTSQKVTAYVTNRYKVTEEQDAILREIDSELNIPPSAIVRIALNTFLPKLRDSGFKYSGVKELYNKEKF